MYDAIKNIAEIHIALNTCDIVYISQSDAPDVPNNIAMPHINNIFASSFIVFAPLFLSTYIYVICSISAVML